MSELRKYHRSLLVVSRTQSEYMVSNLANLLRNRNNFHHYNYALPMSPDGICVGGWANKYTTSLCDHVAFDGDHLHKQVVIYK